MSGLQTVEYYGRGAGGQTETAPGRAFGSALAVRRGIGEQPTPVRLDQVSLEEQDRIPTGYQERIAYWGAALCPGSWF